MNKTTKKVLFSVLAVLLLVSIFYIVRFIGFSRIISALDDRAGKDSIIDYVKENVIELENGIADFLSENPTADGDITDILSFPKSKMIKDVSRNRTEYSPYYVSPDDRIDFYCGGYGMGSATGYEGFLYLVSDAEIKIDLETGAANMSPLGFHGPYRADKKDWFLPDGDGWRWKEENGDNTVYVEHIEGNFYYYLMEF